jgi:hypothetical protein
MTRIEKAIVFAAIIYMIIYAPYFLFQITRDTPPHFVTIIPWHVIGMILNFAAIVATFRDLYRRPFSYPNAKLTWCLLILYTGGIGWLVYIVKHALRPHPDEQVTVSSGCPTEDSESSAF